MVEGSDLEDHHRDRQQHPEPRAHEGYEWLYVITGRMWLIIADHDVVLGPGESPSLTPASRTGSAALATS